MTSSPTSSEPTPESTSPGSQEVDGLSECLRFSLLAYTTNSTGKGKRTGRLSPSGSAIRGLVPHLCDRQSVGASSVQKRRGEKTGSASSTPMSTRGSASDLEFASLAWTVGMLRLDLVAADLRDLELNLRATDAEGRAESALARLLAMAGGR